MIERTKSKLIISVRLTMHHSKPQSQETRRRALTSLPLPRLIEENICVEMDIENEEDNSLCPPQLLSNDRFMSPDSSNLSKNRLNSTCLTTFESLNKYFTTSKKGNTDVFDDVYFDNCFDKFRIFSLKQFLSTHEITEKLRGKMMDWMIEVLKIYNQKEETVFKSFFILDSYLATKKSCIKTTELHLIGAACMLIATKQEEIAPIRLNVFFEEICKKKFTKEQIIDKEIEVLTTISFKTQFPTNFDLCRCGLRLLDIDDREITLFIQNISLLISKMCLFSCNIIDQYSYPEIVMTALILSLKLVENLKSYFGSEVHVSLVDSENS